MTEEWVVNRTIDIDAPISSVWRTLTDPDWSQAWITDDRTTRVSSTWQVGEPISFAGHWDGVDYQDHGTLLAFEPGLLLRYSYWSVHWQVPDAPENYSRAEFRLEPNGDATRLILQHSRFPVHTIFGHWRFYWWTALDRLKAVAEQGDPNVTFPYAGSGQSSAHT